ncbi:MAG: phospholipase D-like domain-containing protein, partial [Myxococcota bacterium]
MRRISISVLLALTALTAACMGLDDVGVAGQSGYITAGSPEAAAVLGLVNDPDVDQSQLDDDVGLDRRAATNIIAHRDGPDAVTGTSDDDLFDSIVELDGVSYVGESALAKLLAYAQAHGYMPGLDAPTAAELDYVTLSVANTLSQADLDDAVGLDRRAATNITDWRAGLDGLANSADDRTFMRLSQLDGIAYVGPKALGQLRDWGVANGYLDALPAHAADTIFSPQPYPQSHNVAVANLIDQAQHSLDIAMYSFSDNGIYDALEAAVLRGVTVRFLFETAHDDRKKTGAALDASRSARLENMGIDVRWVNKIMHHKFAIIDGPRQSLAQAETALVVTGSGNWSFGAATKYDENTLFLEGEVEVTLRLQREFNHLWDHSRDFAYVTSLVPPTAIPIADQDIVDGDHSHAFFTSDNFNVSGDTFSVRPDGNRVAHALVDAISEATDSIWIASGHLRSRPVAEALMAKRQAMPGLDIRIYLDGQEYISSWYHQTQLDRLDDCLIAAGTSTSKQRKCRDRGFYFGYEVGQSGIDVRYKYYAFRWHYTYAAQMHNKFLLIDGDELWTGSYNLSDNAEHNTFENMIVLRGLPHADTISAYATRFLDLWETERNGSRYADLMTVIENDAVIPLVFEPMALDHGEVAALKSAIAAACPQVFSSAFRDDPAAHQSCAVGN